MTLADKLLGIFNQGEVLTIRDVARRSGYGETTATCYLPKLVNAGRLWRVAHGKYSLDPEADSVFDDQRAIMEAVRGRSFWTARFARRVAKLPLPAFAAAMRQLLKRGVVKPVRRGVYSTYTPS